jgi:hypothetical protein
MRPSGDCIRALPSGERRAMRLLACVLLTAASATAQLKLYDPADAPARATAAAVLSYGVAASKSDGEAGDERLRAAIATACSCLPAGSAARAVAEELRASTAEPKALAKQAAAFVSDLTFKPVAEAELPAGVPGFAVLDEVEIRTYPTYRMVKTAMKGGSMGAFWPLFNHIKDNEIAMTTPVQVDYAEDGERQREASMAFLYGSPDLGPLRKDGSVEVVDMPPLTVLTLGSRGYDRKSRVEELRARMDAWLADHPEWQVAGPMRTMGYNSPSVAGNRRYFEVQIPIQPKPAKAQDAQ